MGKRRVTEREKVGGGERERPGSLAAACRASGEWHFSMWLAYGANCGSSTRSGESEEWLALTAFTQEGQGWWSWRMIQMSVSGQVSHLSRGTGQVTLAPSCGESSRRLVMTSHYELGAVLSTWPIPNTTVAYLALMWTEGEWTHKYSWVCTEHCPKSVKIWKDDIAWSDSLACLLNLPHLNHETSDYILFSLMFLFNTYIVW